MLRAATSFPVPEALNIMIYHTTHSWYLLIHYVHSRLQSFVNFTAQTKDKE